jgi:hypothetical protein
MFNMPNHLMWGDGVLVVVLSSVSLAMDIDSRCDFGLFSVW